MGCCSSTSAPALTDLLIFQQDQRFHPDVRLLITAVSTHVGDFLALSEEPDNAAYGAALGEVGGVAVRFRVARVTPTKSGLFVTVWRRAPDGSTEPFPADEDLDLLTISARQGCRFGVFVLPRSALIEHGIASVAGVGGKRGFRLYPPWSETRSLQAKRSQAWQSQYFLELGDGSVVDSERARQLFAAV